MGKIAIMLMCAKLISKIFGFFRDIALSYFYGASDVSDAYLICITIPVVIFTFIGQGLTTSYIPVYNKICQDEDESEAERFTSNLINLSLMTCSLIIFLCLVFTRPIVKVFASGFSEDILDMTVKFTRISIWGIYFTTIGYIGTAYLHMKDRYILPALTGVVLNTLVILGIFFSTKIDPMLISLGHVIGIALQALIISRAMYGSRFRHLFIFDYRDKSIKKMVYLTLPLILGISADQINVLVDRTISSRILIGGVSSLIYANRLTLFIQTLFVTTISVVIYPRITKLASENKMESHRELFKKSLVFVSIILFPITIGTAAFSESIIKFLYGRGAFDAEAARITSSALFYYALGMTGVGFRELLLKVFYSLEDTRTSTKNAIISVGLNIVLNIILSRYLGIAGLALATSIAATFCALLLLVSLRRKLGPLGLSSLAVSLGKILLASIGMGIVTKGMFFKIAESTGDNTALVLSVGIGSFIYLLITCYMRIPEIEEIKEGVKRFMEKRN